MMIISANFQASSFPGMAGKRGDRQTCDVTPFSCNPFTKKMAQTTMIFLNFLPCFGREGLGNLRILVYASIYFLKNEMFHY